jgi:hypothetical protein
MKMGVLVIIRKSNIARFTTNIFDGVRSVFALYTKRFSKIKLEILEYVRSYNTKKESYPSDRLWAYMFARRRGPRIV